MLDDHLLHRAFGQVRIERGATEIEELSKGSPVFGVGLAFVADEAGQILAQLLNSAFELVDRLLPLVERGRPPSEKKGEDVNKLVGLGEVGVEELLAVLVQNRSPRLLEKNVVARVAGRPCPRFRSMASRRR